VLGDDGVDPARVRKVVLCSGKVFYDLIEARETWGHHDVALVRIEQLYPFPASQVQAALGRYSPQAVLVWAQEEPRNMGAWRFMRESLLDGLVDGGGRELGYVGRAASAAPAPGSLKTHAAEQEALVREAVQP
jgi:2-oxoglutarate dehydrogenase E1 component